MQRFQKGDHSSFETLYLRYKAPIYSYILRLLCTTSDNAKELTQEVFLRIIRNANGFRYGSRCATWIFTIARNLAIDSIRKAKHRRHESLDQKIGGDGAVLHDRLPGYEPEPDRASTRARLQYDLNQAISKLPDEQREVFLLREYHGLQFKEIAAITNTKEGTVKSRMRYALDTLKGQLEHYTDYARTLP